SDGQQFAIGGIGGREQRRRVFRDIVFPLQLRQFLAGGDVPEPGGLIPTAGGERLAIRREGDAVNRAGVQRQGGDFGEGGDIPQFHRGVGAAGGHDFPVAREGHRQRVAVVRQQGALAAARGHVPLLDGEVPACG